MNKIGGGGQYEYDIFYEMCDAAGILIWHDMVIYNFNFAINYFNFLYIQMFACAMYPGESSDLENIKHETYDNVRRLRNHPSIAIWNGNNEVWIGW